MQNGSMMRTERHGGPDVWEFRWREPGPDGKSRHRRMVVGTTNEFGDEVAARQAIAGLHLRMNARNERVKVRPITLSELVDHYRQRELKPDTLWKTHSTKVTYDGYLNKWIVPRWGNYTLSRISAGEVELWLRSLALAKSSCAKIRNIMSVLFNHGIRHEICKYNPIRLVRQGAKRKKFPTVLSASEVQQLIASLALRERTLVLLDAGTGLRMSELFALKWRDINFQSKEISITRSIVFQVVGPCKTEASQKPIPLDAYLAEALRTWREYTPYRKPDDWVFASPATSGKKPYWGQTIMRSFIRPAAVKIGIAQHIGWHTFRHTYSSLLAATKADIKVMQELLRHASSRVTLDTYTQAVTIHKRRAQSRVIRLFRAPAVAAA
ncbi:MAG: site-specific integrase [Verrucomicrobia bacterium]|nr:MAG: site-specific integrase [Verrucomicrobiota bacterium]